MYKIFSKNAKKLHIAYMENLMVAHSNAEFVIHI